MILHIAGKVHFYFKLSLPIIRSNGVLTMRQQGSNSNLRGVQGFYLRYAKRTSKLYVMGLTTTSTTYSTKITIFCTTVGHV